jgi:hypothetical protein
MEQIPGSVTYATCRWTHSGLVCAQQFNPNQAHEFNEHLCEHVEAHLKAETLRRKQTPATSTLVTSISGLTKDPKETSVDCPERDKKQGWGCQWQGCGHRKEFNRKANLKIHVTGLHNPFPLFECKVW